MYLIRTNFCADLILCIGQKFLRAHLFSVLNFVCESIFLHKCAKISANKVYIHLIVDFFLNSETQLQITLHPSTGDFDEQKFVCLTLVCQISKDVGLVLNYIN